MARYESDDIITIHFIIKNDIDHDENLIKGWTDDKELAKFYLKFHNHPSFHMKSITKDVNEMRKITEENMHDEINIVNVYTIDRNKKKPELKLIVIPATTSEMTFLREEQNSFLSNIIDYARLAEAVPLLKKKYQVALNTLLLGTIIKRVVYNRKDDMYEYIDMDALKVLFRSFPDEFK